MLSGSRGVDGGSKVEGMDPCHHHYASLGGPGEEYTSISIRAERQPDGYNKSALRRGAGQPGAGTSKEEYINELKVSMSDMRLDNQG